MEELELLKVDINDLPILNPALRSIPVFRRLIERDKGSKGDHDGRKKRQCIKELAFIHLMVCYYQNPYWKYDDKKVDYIKKDLEMPDDWYVDEDVSAAMEFWAERNGITDEMDMILAAEQAARATSKYLRGVDYERRDGRGNLVYKPEVVLKTIQVVDATVDKLVNGKERLEKHEKLKTGKIRGGGEAGNRERPRNAN